MVEGGSSSGSTGVPPLAEGELRACTWEPLEPSVASLRTHIPCKSVLLLFFKPIFVYKTPFLRTPKEEVSGSLVGPSAHNGGRLKLTHRWGCWNIPSGESSTQYPGKGEIVEVIISAWNGS